MDPMVHGVSKTTGNAWQKCGFAIETSGTYPRKVYFTLFGDKTSQCPSMGQDVTVDFDAESRQWGERWYTDLSAWRVEQPQQQPSPSNQAPVHTVTQAQPEPMPRQATMADVFGAPPAQTAQSPAHADDLPF